MKVASAAKQHSRNLNVCIFCLHTTRPLSRRRVAWQCSARNFESSCSIRQSPSIEDGTPPASPAPAPRKFGGFASRAQPTTGPKDSAIDWGEAKERASLEGAVKDGSISSQPPDDRLKRPTDQRSTGPRITRVEPRARESTEPFHFKTIDHLPRRPQPGHQAPQQAATAAPVRSPFRRTQFYPTQDQPRTFRPSFIRKPTEGAAPPLPRQQDASPTTERRQYARPSPPPLPPLVVPDRSGQRPVHEYSFQAKSTPETAELRRRGGYVVDEQPPLRVPQRSHKGPQASTREDRRERGENEVEDEESKPTRRYNDKNDKKPGKGGGKHGKDVKADRRSQKFAEDEDDWDEMDDEDLDAQRERKRKRKAKKAADREAAAANAAPKNVIELPAFISVQALATSLHVRPEEFVAKLEDLGFEEIAMDHVLNHENASLVAMEYGLEPVADTSEQDDITARPAPADPSLLPQRPPIVTIMGHVDHGKTTLLDYLRQSSVAAEEHGGITQHIGAFSVPIASADNRLITFLDTPGHAAFLSMRQRGANVTDIVVLVVAADDSVKPQTIEAIKHAKSANVQIIVAITKCDKESADPKRVMSDLIQHDIEVESFGGTIQSIEVSAKTGTGIPDLVEALLAQADVLDMRAETDGPPEGWVLEASTKRSGRSATVLVRRGTLRVGDVLLAGATWGRVRAMYNEAGVRVDAAAPGTPVEVEGWRDQPEAGDEVLGAPSESRAHDVVAFRRARADRIQAGVDMEAINASRRTDAERRALEKEAATDAINRVKATEATGAVVRGKDLVEAGRQAKASVRRDFGAPDDAGENDLYILVKADVGGSAEAVVGGIEALPLGKHPVSISILKSGPGHISESDVAYAAAAPAGQGFIVNFNQEIPAAMAALAERSGVRVLDDSVIYRILDAVRAEAEARLPPIVTKRVLGEAEAVQSFEIRGAGRAVTRIAGCRVKNGQVQRSDLVRVFRGGVGGEMVFEGRLASLKNVKKDVDVMRKGSECGIAFEGWGEFKDGDVIQTYEEVRETRRLV